MPEPEQPELPAHGTYARYQRERRRGKPCEACQAAATAYQRRWRTATGDRTGREYRRARNRALTTLARMYPEEFEELLAWYRAKLQHEQQKEEQ